MADLRRLFDDTLLEHYRHPRHAEPLSGPARRARAESRACGDRCDVALALDDSGRVAKLSVTTEGCVVATAAGSIWAEHSLGVDAALLRGWAEGLLARFGTPAPRREGSTARGDDSTDSRVPATAPNTGQGDIPVPLSLLARSLEDFPLRQGCAALPALAILRALEREESAQERG